VPLRMLWYFEGKLMINDISFEDRERTLEEIKTLFFYTMYLWTVAFVSPLVINYHDLLVLFSHSSLSFFFFSFFFYLLYVLLGCLMLLIIYLNYL
jgi:hypothetical protein